MVESLVVLNMCVVVLTILLIAFVKVFHFLNVRVRVQVEVSDDVVLQIPRQVLIKHHEQQSKLLLHVPPLPVRRRTPAQSPLPADHQRSQKTTVHILHMGGRVFVLHSVAQNQLNS